MADFDEENEVFREIIKAALPDKMISNFILIAEIVDNESEELSIFTSDAMTPWLAVGMLESANDMVRTNRPESKLDGDS